jgi:hypothetical protein
MKRSLLTAIVLASAIGGIAAVAGGTQASTSAAAPSLHVLPAVAALPPSAAEVQRIRTHLARVEQELRARVLPGLTAAQRAARARHLDVLREYHQHGKFPLNHDFPGERVPYFVDEHGTHCAMAFLIARDGGGALVARVAATANNARIRDLAGDAELLAWLDAAGLSVEEAARIQPMYGWFPPPEPQRGAVPAGYAVASGLTSAAGGAAIALNLTRPAAGAGRWKGAFGLLTGAAGIGLGGARLNDGGAVAALAAVNTGVGLTAAAFGLHTLLSGAPDRPTRDEPPPAAARNARVEIAPLLDAEQGSGLMLNVRF